MRHWTPVDLTRDGEGAPGAAGRWPMADIALAREGRRSGEALPPLTSSDLARTQILRRRKGGTTANHPLGRWNPGRTAGVTGGGRDDHQSLRRRKGRPPELVAEVSGAELAASGLLWNAGRRVSRVGRRE